MSDKISTSSTGLSISCSGLSGPASSCLAHNFYFAVNGKRFYCNSVSAAFLSPKVTELHTHDPQLDHFSLDIECQENDFDLFVQLMQGEEITPSLSQYSFIHKVGFLLGNEEIVKSFSAEERESLSPLEAIGLLASVPSDSVKSNELIEFITLNMHTLSYKDLEILDFDKIKRIIVHPKLCLSSEEQLFNIITSFIENKGSEYRSLLTHIGFQSLSPESMNKFISLVWPEDLTPELWLSISQRLFMRVKESAIKERYILKETSIPYESDPLKGIFAYLRDLSGGKNPAESGLVNIVPGDTECSVPVKSVLDYGTKSRWYLAEKENNTVTFDFLKGKIALSGYTITSGSSSSYWEYPTSWTWEGSNDQVTWVEIDSRSQNTDLGANEKTYTWKCPISPLFHYVRFRLRDITRHGGLYCREFELFGAYQDPPQ